MRHVVNRILRLASPPSLLSDLEKGTRDLGNQTLELSKEVGRLQREIASARQKQDREEMELLFKEFRAIWRRQISQIATDLQSLRDKI